MDTPNDIFADMVINDTAENVSGYNYYGFAHRKDKWVIVREKTDKTEYRYAFGSTDYATGWANKGSHTYIRVDQLS